MVLLRRAFSTGDYCIGDQRKLFRRFEEACRALSKGRSPVGQERQLSLTDGLSRRRSRSDLESDLLDPKLVFLNGELRARHNPNLSRAKLLLDQVASGVLGAGTDERIMPHGAALFRLWAAMRELMSDDGLHEPAATGLWDRALGLWAAKASWFGLHGHVWMGPLAAVNTQAALRRHQRGNLPSDDPAVREPMGARASAVYSIARHARTRNRKVFHFRQATSLASQALHLDRSGQQGVLAIRGNASLQLGTLGYAWMLWDAVADFESALRLREDAGASAASIGEMQVDLGLCYVLTGRGKRGLALMQHGIAGLRTNTTANGLAFLARGLRKLDVAARVLLKPALSREARAEIAMITEKTEAMDQARDL
jgi:hypothetical protein